MLDVLNSPPQVTVPIEWIAERVRKPDTDRTVLVYMPEDEDDPVWVGYWNETEQAWFTTDHDRLGSFVTWWAERPVGPGIA